MRLVTIVGTRPQFVKAAAVTRAITAHNRSRPELPIVERLVHTGQHYDPTLSSSFFSELGLPEPAFHLGVGSGSHATQTGEMLRRVEEVLATTTADLVLVHGDSNTTLAGALAAAKMGLPVAHVEAGLRSGRRDMPEEVNRLVTDRLSTLLFCPSETAVANLAAEGIVDGVTFTGDVMLDVLDHALQGPPGEPPPPRPPSGRYALATVHRAANADDPARLGAIVAALLRLAEGGLPVVLPLHPRTRAAMGRDGLTQAEARLHVTEPVGHRAALRLAAGARVVLTDSGGLQKEAFWLGVPCVTLRDETEWTETLDGGWNVLAGHDPDRIVAAAHRPAPSGPRPPVYGAGGAAGAVVERLAAWAER